MRLVGVGRWRTAGIEGEVEVPRRRLATATSLGRAFPTVE
jgi:hypothetical protein